MARKSEWTDAQIIGFTKEVDAGVTAKDVGRRFGLPKRSFNALRQFFGTTLVRREANLEAVRELSGHSDLLMPQRYVNANHQPPCGGRDARDGDACRERRCSRQRRQQRGGQAATAPDSRAGANGRRVARGGGVAATRG